MVQKSLVVNAMNEFQNVIFGNKLLITVCQSQRKCTKTCFNCQSIEYTHFKCSQKYRNYSFDIDAAMQKVFTNWHICVYFRMNTRTHSQFKRTTHSLALQVRTQSIYICMAQINARMPLIITPPHPWLQLPLQLQLKYEICIWFVCVRVCLFAVGHAHWPQRLHRIECPWE